jgi:hypothetical protein
MPTRYTRARVGFRGGNSDYNCYFRHASRYYNHYHGRYGSAGFLGRLMWNHRALTTWAIMWQPVRSKTLWPPGGRPRQAQTSRRLLEVLRVRSPNLTLNVPDDIPRQFQVWTVAFMGFVIQVVVMVINAVVVYRWEWLRSGSLVASYGYPTWAVGTVCITFGVTLCSYVVQSSTETYAAEPKDPSFREKFVVVRLQAKIDGLHLPAYAIPSSSANAVVRISLQEGEMRKTAQMRAQQEVQEDGKEDGKDGGEEDVKTLAKEIAKGVGEDGTKDNAKDNTRAVANEVAKGGGKDH